MFLFMAVHGISVGAVGLEAVESLRFPTRILNVASGGRCFGRLPFIEKSGKSEQNRGKKFISTF
jgi:hypothetical protein